MLNQLYSNSNKRSKTHRIVDVYPRSFPFNLLAWSFFSPFSGTDLRTLATRLRAWRKRRQKSWYTAGRNPEKPPEWKNPTARGEAVSTVPDEFVSTRPELTWVEVTEMWKKCGPTFCNEVQITLTHSFSHTSSPMRCLVLFHSQNTLAVRVNLNFKQYPQRQSFP